jgi:hypothetical protein
MDRAIELPGNISDKRFQKKAEALMHFYCDLSKIDFECLVDIPIENSLSLGLYNKLKASLKSDAIKTLEYKRG